MSTTRDRLRRYWLDYQRANGQPPTTEEAANYLRVTRQTVHGHLLRLQRTGHAYHARPGKRRGWSVR